MVVKARMHWLPQCWSTRNDYCIKFYLTTFGKSHSFNYFEVIQFETFGGPQKTPSLNMIKTFCSLTSSNVDRQFIKFRKVFQKKCLFCWIFNQLLKCWQICICDTNCKDLYICCKQTLGNGSGVGVMKRPIPPSVCDKNNHRPHLIEWASFLPAIFSNTDIVSELKGTFGTRIEAIDLYWHLF